MEEALPARVRFGAFELDLRSGELLRSGRKVLLQEQSFRVLRMLVERRGEIVGREEIQKKLWPNSTIVEFDRGINAVINKLRKLLDDSAEEPTYIGTVARRGYRLLVAVEVLSSSAADTPPAAEAAEPDDASLERARLRASSLSGTTVSHYRVLEV